MQAVTEKVLNDALSKLKAIGAKYKILMPEGEEFGELEIVRPKTRAKKVYTIPPGTAARIYKKKIEGMEVGAVVSFTPEEYAGMNADHFKKTVQSGMIAAYGNGSQTTVIDESTGNVETMRMK